MLSFINCLSYDVFHSDGTITKTMLNVFVDIWTDKPPDIVIRTMTIFSWRYIHAIMLTPKLSNVSSQVYSDSFHISWVNGTGALGSIRYDTVFISSFGLDHWILGFVCVILLLECES